ncbi:hypothetical protein L208DRAFT_1157456, partial [Tricholoma matsutake]
SFIINFTYHILNMLGFTGEEGDCIIWWHQDMPLFMCGQNRHTIADMWISHLTSETQEDPEAPLVGQAIAVFQIHNRVLHLMCLPPMKTKVIPAIVMNGTMPMLYKFEITAGLV